jgi:very-short-patch-repair endonuclease
MAFTPHRRLVRARALRYEQTAAERRLWGYLSDPRQIGAKFVRQHPIGPYVADFVCREQRLIVEVDGGTYWSEEQVAHDRRRTAYLEREGYRGVRVSNGSVYHDLDGVLGTIIAALEGRLAYGLPTRAGRACPRSWGAVQ